MKMRFLLIPCLGFLLPGCENGGSIDSTYDPLDPAGGTRSEVDVVQSGYRKGQFVETIMDQAAFFNQRPDGEAEASQLLPAATVMKVIDDDDSFIKVELDSGKVGYVSTVQVAPRGEVSAVGMQSWPPTDAELPLEAAAGGDDSTPIIPLDVSPDEEVAAPEVPEPAADPTPLAPQLPAAAPEDDADRTEADPEDTGLLESVGG